MEADELLKKFDDLGIWVDGDRRAPHKPIMLLYALSQLQQGNDVLTYSKIYKPVENILRVVMPNKSYAHSHYPYWYLKNDSIWHILNLDDLKFRKGKSEPLKSELKKYNTQAGFKTEVLELFHKQPDLIVKVAKMLLEAHFPDTLQEDVVSMLNIDLEERDSVRRKRRDPRFRNRVLVAYGYRCAVCGYSVRLDDTSIGLEAAHIKWHQAGGPDQENNGFSLCSLHHKLFDRGAFTVSQEYELRVSKYVNGPQAGEALQQFHEHSIKLPRDRHDYPLEEFLDWHYHEVFAK